MLDALIKCGDIEKARSVFDATTNKTVPVYGTIMTGYTKNNQPEEAIEIFNDAETQRFLRKENPNSFADTKMVGGDSRLVVYLCAMTALSNLAMSDVSESIVKGIPSTLLVHPHIQNALIDMWVSDHP